MRKIFLALLFMGCATEPEVELQAGWSTEVVDSVMSIVTFEAQAPDTLWWKLEWVDLGILMDYGRAVYGVEVPVSYQTDFKFWLDFTAWTDRDTAMVTFMSPGG